MIYSNSSEPRKIVRTACGPRTGETVYYDDKGGVWTDEFIDDSSCTCPTQKADIFRGYIFPR